VLGLELGEDEEEGDALGSTLGWELETWLGEDEEDTLGSMLGSSLGLELEPPLGEDEGTHWVQ
jgi:hypothetical protein